MNSLTLGSLLHVLCLLLCVAYMQAKSKMMDKDKDKDKEKGTMTMTSQTAKTDMSVAEAVQALGKGTKDNGLSELATQLARFPDLMHVLDTSTAVTLFAPTNAAMRRRNATLVGTDQLHDLLAYHIVHMDVGSHATTPAVLVATTHLRVGSKDGRRPETAQQLLLVNNKEHGNVVLLHGTPEPVVTLQDGLACRNGRLFPINGLLEPPGAFVATGRAFRLHGFMDALGRVGLATQYERLVGLTLFVPSTSVLQSYLRRHPGLRPVQLAVLLQHHVVRGSLDTSRLRDGMVLTSEAGLPLVLTSVDDVMWSVNGQAIRTPNILTANGVIHVLDGGLLDPFKQRGSALGSQTFDQGGEALPGLDADKGLPEALGGTESSSNPGPDSSVDKAGLDVPMVVDGEHQPPPSSSHESNTSSSCCPANVHSCLTASSLLFLFGLLLPSF